MRTLTLISTLGLALLLGSGCAPASDADPQNERQDTREIGTQYENIRLVKVAGNLERPWSLAFLPDGRMLVTELAGRLNIVEDGRVTEVSGVPEVEVEIRVAFSMCCSTPTSRRTGGST